MQPDPYGIKRLPYPINRRTLLEQDDLLSFTQGDPLNTSDCSWFVVQLTNEDRLKFTSALLAGMDLIYPDEFVSLMQLWLQPTDFPNQFPPTAEGCPPVDLCDLILECIDTTPALQQAIANYSLTSSITETTPEQPIILATDIFADQGPCANDNIFGMTLQLADFLNAVSEDILELFVTAFAAPGRLGDLIEAIPVVGSLPFDDIFQLLEKLAEQVNDAYQAGYDTQIREDIACDLFCIAQDDCELTLEQARDYFKDKLLVAVSDSDWASIANDIIANNWLGEQSIYVMHWMILDTMIFGGEMLGIDVNRMVTTVATFFNDPDPDWVTLCTNCNTWQQTFDFTIDQQGWLFAANRGSYVAGVGFKSLKYSSNETAIYIYNDNLNVNDITDVTITGLFEGDTTVTTRFATLLKYDSGQNLSTVLLYTPPNALTSLNWNIDFQNYGVRCQLYFSGFTGSNPPLFTMQNMTINGTGVNPFI